MAWIDTISRLFSQNIIIKRLPGDRLKTIRLDDLDKLQSQSIPRYSKVKSKFGSRFLGHGYSSATNIETLESIRQNLYMEYALMDSDPILNSALDIYADETTARNAQGYTLTINSSNPNIKKILYNLFYEILNIEFNLWSWVRTCCKFGDLMLFLEVNPSVGIVDVVPIHPAFIRRVEEEYNGETGVGYKTKYIYEGPEGRAFSRKSFDDLDIAHFRLITDTDYLPYGKSMLDGARKVYTQLALMEDAMLLHRIMRAPERRIFKIDVGGIPPESIDGYIESMANDMKKVPLMDEQGNYNLRYNIMNMFEDIFIPTRGGDSGTEVDTLAGLQNDGAIDDIEYLRKKMMSTLKIPLSYLGYETAGDVKTSLASEDIRFARTTERIQKIFCSELKRMAKIHLACQSFKDDELLDFDITLSPPSMIYERQKIDLLNEKVNLVSNLIEHKLWSRKKIYEEIFGMTHEEWSAETSYIIEDLKLGFRFKQIEDEGNDPKVTKKAIGTPHSIASLYKSENDNDMKHVVASFDKDERSDNEGRPEKHGSYGRHKDPAYGLDPFGEKELQSDNKNSIMNLISE
jgi:hypothetical protein